MLCIVLFGHGVRMSKPFENTAPLLRGIRQFLGISQAEYAKQLKVHVQFISNWERGLCLPPNPQMKKIYKKMTPLERTAFEIRVREDKGNQYMKKIRG